MDALSLFTNWPLVRRGQEPRTRGIHRQGSCMSIPRVEGTQLHVSLFNPRHKQQQADAQLPYTSSGVKAEPIKIRQKVKKLLWTNITSPGPGASET